ncbi:uncharacterized protein LOC142575137 isoform X1 [Dermacentor variabilis]|uniref:uncharacterized protein LOC142575137 isoform X1 n=2 Tax=Dermacentor variabilis TaxID=34621 RepID=UPI003F5AF8A3
MAVLFHFQVFKIIALLSVVFVLSVDYTLSAEQITACDPARVTACVGDLRKMSSDPMKDLEVAEDVAGLEHKCREMEEAKSCLERETSFCSEEIRSIYMNYLRPVTASFQDLCNAGETRDEYLKYAPCFGRMSRRDGPCSGKYERLSKLMSSEMDFTQQHNSTLPQFCCYFYAFYNCYRAQTEKQCGAQAYRLFERYTGYLSSSLFTGSCEKHLNHTECDAVASSTTGRAPALGACGLPLLALAAAATALRRWS